MKCLCCLCVGGCVDTHTREKQGTGLSLICVWRLPPLHVSLHHGAAGRAAAIPWTKDSGIEQDKTLTSHQHLSSPSSFSHPLSPLFWHGAGIPLSCSTLAVCWGKCHKPEAEPHSDGRWSKVSWRESISAAEIVQDSCGSRALGSLLLPRAHASLTAFQHALSPPSPSLSHVHFNDLSRKVLLKWLF